MNETNLHNGAFHLHCFQKKLKQLTASGSFITSRSHAPDNCVAKQYIMIRITVIHMTYATACIGVHHFAHTDYSGTGDKFNQHI
jgi:hypothetical protein